MFEIDLLLFTSTPLSCFPKLVIDERFRQPPWQWQVPVVWSPTGFCWQCSRDFFFLLSCKPFTVQPQNMLPLFSPHSCQAERCLVPTYVPCSYAFDHTISSFRIIFPPHPWKFILTATFSLSSRYLCPTLMWSLCVSTAAFKAFCLYNPSLTLSCHHAQLWTTQFYFYIIRQPKEYRTGIIILKKKFGMGNASIDTTKCRRKVEGFFFLNIKRDHKSCRKGSLFKPVPQRWLLGPWRGGDSNTQSWQRTGLDIDKVGGGRVVILLYITSSLYKLTSKEGSPSKIVRAWGVKGQGIEQKRKLKKRKNRKK